MNKLFTVAFTIFFTAMACSKKPQTVDQSSTEEKIENAATTDVPKKTKSKYEIRKELEGFFTRKTYGNIEQVFIKGVEVGGSGVYCYFLIRNARVFGLTFNINYSEFNADTFEIEVDGKVLSTHEVNKSQAASGTMDVVQGAVFSWYEKHVNQADVELIEKMSKAKKVTLVLKKNASEFTRFNLAKSECQSLLRTVDYYQSLNGAKIPKKGMVNIRG